LEPTVDAPAPSEQCADSEERLWRDLRAEHQEIRAAVRERLFLLHLPYAKALSARLFARRTSDDVGFNDYYQFACLGLLQSIDRFDASLQVQFRTFCTTRIEGSILSGLEKMSEVRDQVSARKRVQRERAASLKRPNFAATAADRVGAIHALADVAVGLALGYILEDCGLYLPEETPALPDLTYESVAWRSMRARIASFVKDLPEPDRRVLELHYFHGIGFAEIGELLKVTKGRVSQIHRRGLNALREKMTNHEEFLLTG
jgi:RNA polymerase sigma factor for flagellar operon FliA